jgi:cell division protein FtsB
MEKHVPIIFFDLEDEDATTRLADSIQRYGGSDGEEEEDDSDEIIGGSRRYTSRRSKSLPKKRRPPLKTCSEDGFLKLEAKGESDFIDLKLVSWNDSSRVEIRDNNNETGGFEEPPVDLDPANYPLRAVSRWDSSEHKSIYLNQITPVDKIIYLTLKLNVKMKILPTTTTTTTTNVYQITGGGRKTNNTVYLNCVMRKRICVNVGLNSSLGGSASSPSTNRLISLNRFKNIMGSTTANLIGNMAKPSTSVTLNSTSLTYRLIASVPNLLTEIENRESLATKAATSITEELINELTDNSNQESPTMEYKSLDSSIGHLEHYAKTIEAVDTVLERDRAQQKTELRRLVARSRRTAGQGQDSSSGGEDGQSSEGSSEGRATAMKKTFSVPNLIKNLTIYQANQSSADFKDLRLNAATSAIIDEVAPASESELNQGQTFIITNQQDDLAHEADRSLPAPSKASLEILQLYEVVRKDDEQEQARLSNLKRMNEESEAKIASLLFQDFLSEPVEPQPPPAVVVVYQSESEVEPTVLIFYLFIF